MATCHDVITQARYTLNDPETDSSGTAIEPRNSNTELMVYLNAGLAEARVLRPDLFFASLGTAFVPLAIGDDFPIPIQHEATLSAYLIFRAESKDDESVNSGRAVAFRALFKELLASL
jgi:hypothetical protein